MLERTPDLALVWLSRRIAVAGPQIEETMDAFLLQLRRLPGYRLIWRGPPATIPEYRASHWLLRQPNSAGFQLNDSDWRDYRNPARPNVGMGSARKSFSSAVAVLSGLAGQVPKEVVVFTLD